MKRLNLLFVALLMFSDVSFAAEPVPQDFAYGYYLEVSGDYPVYEVSVPQDLYSGLTRGDLGDLCVFNAQGEVVPFVLRSPAPAVEAEQERRALPLFPIMGEPDKGLGGVSMQVKRDDKGAIINVTTSDAGTRDGQALVAYLADADGLKEPINKLALDTLSMPEGGMARLNVEYSNDLQNWYTLVSGATVADLNYGGHSLRMRDVELGSISAKYYRITPYARERMVELAGVSAVLARKSVEPVRSWTTVRATAVPEKSGAYSFGTGGRMPVDRLRVRLPQKNTLVDAEFLSRPSDNAGWTSRARTLVYGLRVDGSELRNPDIGFAPTTDGDWLMRVIPGSGGLGSGVPDMELGWAPHRLVFVARGAAPFLLAYGSGRASPNSGGSGYLLDKVEELNRRNTTIRPAVLGEKTTLGGEDALLSEAPPFDLKKLVLWAILLIGVAVLAVMALTLYRSMSKAGGDA